MLLSSTIGIHGQVVVRMTCYYMVIFYTTQSVRWKSYLRHVIPSSNECSFKRSLTGRFHIQLCYHFDLSKSLPTRNYQKCSTHWPIGWMQASKGHHSLEDKSFHILYRRSGLVMATESAYPIWLRTPKSSTSCGMKLTATVSLVPGLKTQGSSSQGVTSTEVTSPCCSCEAQCWNRTFFEFTALTENRSVAKKTKAPIFWKACIWLKKSEIRISVGQLKA